MVFNSAHHVYIRTIRSNSLDAVDEILFPNLTDWDLWMEGPDLVSDIITKQQDYITNLRFVICYLYP